MKLRKNIVLYITIWAIVFFLLSIIFSYPKFNFTQLSYQEIQYATWWSIIAMVITSMIKISCLIKKTRKEAKKN